MTQLIEQEIRTLRSIFWSGRDPEGRAFVSLADAYRRSGEFRQAVEILTDGLDRHPGFASGHLVAAQLYREKGLSEEAEFSFQRVLDLDPDNVVALDILADCLAARGALDEAGSLRGRLRVLTGVRETKAAQEAEPAEAAALEMGDLAPAEPAEEWAAPDEPETVVFEMSALAPDEPETVVFDMSALAPDEPETVVFDMSALAPDEPETVVFEMSALAPDEPVVELAPAYHPVEDALVADNLDPEPMVTRTMAELFASQGLVTQALEIFGQLLQVTPGDLGLRQRVAELSARPGGSEGPGSVAEAPAPLPGADAAQRASDDDGVAGHSWDADAHVAPHDVETPFAWTEQDPDEAEPVGPPISSYFARMLGWEPSPSLESGADASPDDQRSEEGDT